MQILTFPLQVVVSLLVIVLSLAIAKGTLVLSSVLMHAIFETTFWKNADMGVTTNDILPNKH